MEKRVAPPVCKGDNNDKDCHNEISEGMSQMCMLTVSEDQQQNTLTSFPQLEPSEAVASDVSRERIPSSSGQAPSPQKLFHRSSKDDIYLWWQSLSDRDTNPLHHTREYTEFLKAASRLRRAHDQIVSSWRDLEHSAAGLDNATVLSPTVLTSTEESPQKSFEYQTSWQYGVGDEILLRVLTFLECADLSSVAITCTRFHRLVKKYTNQATSRMQQDHQLSTSLKLYRALEQIRGIAAPSFCSVPIPTLLLPQRIVVTESGDSDYNGIYFCTGCNANGYVFSKPWSRPLSAPKQAPSLRTSPTFINGQNPRVLVEEEDHSAWDTAESSRTVKTGQRLRCVIARRFSHEVCTVYRKQLSAGTTCVLRLDVPVVAG